MTWNLLPKPSPGALLVDLRPAESLTLYASNGSTGSHVWVGDVRSPRFERRLSLNSQLAHLADAKRTLIPYVSADGDSLNALLTLPPDYRPGRRSALVVYVYPGLVVTDTNYLPLDEQFINAMNLQLLVSRGFGVLIPSIPLGLPRVALDPYLEVPKGVMPAIDRAVESGIADPDRLAVMGHSGGGYATYVLLTLTKRFKAAIAIAGITDLFSMYGTFFAPFRYDHFAHERLYGPELLEAGPLQLGASPWADPRRYLRNSPVLHSNRVCTPLLIVHGDMDFVPIQQAEEMFTALYRLGKRAEFVRYWGEGHVIVSPANIRDLWRRIYRWLDLYLGEGYQTNAVGSETCSSTN